MLCIIMGIYTNMHHIIIYVKLYKIKRNIETINLHFWYE